MCSHSHNRHRPHASGSPPAVPDRLVQRLVVLSEDQNGRRYGLDPKDQRSRSRLAALISVVLGVFAVGMALVSCCWHGPVLLVVLAALCCCAATAVGVGSLGIAREACHITIARSGDVLVHLQSLRGAHSFSTHLLDRQPLVRRLEVRDAALGDRHLSNVVVTTRDGEVAVFSSSREEDANDEASRLAKFLRRP